MPPLKDGVATGDDVGGTGRPKPEEERGPGRKPTHQLIIVHKVSKARFPLGSAWETAHGGYSIGLNPAVHLDGKMIDDYFLLLVKMGSREEGG